MFESSTETEQGSYGNLKQNENLPFNKYIDTCPVSLFVNRRQNNIFFSWDCKRIQANPSFFHRHIVFIHTVTFSEEQIIEILTIYYKFLKLGDFMKIIFIGNKNRHDWIEKSCEKINFKKFIPQKISSEKKSYDDVLQRIQKYQQPTLLSIFTNNKAIFQQQEQMEFSSAKQRHKFQYIINFFYYEEFQQSLSQDQRYQIYPFYSLSDLQVQIKVSLIQLSKVRLIKSQLRFTCNNGELDLRKFTDNRWRLEENTLVLTQYGLKNNIHYNETLQFNLDNNIVNFFQVEFRILTINKEQFLMKKTINFNTIKKQKIQNYDILPGNNSHLPMRMIQFSLMNHIRLVQKKADKVIVRQKKNHVKKEYQKI